jgi:hypothetical protein
MDGDGGNFKSSLRGAFAAKQSTLSFCRAMDCFAALAMTVLAV